MTDLLALEADLAALLAPVAAPAPASEADLAEAATLEAGVIAMAGRIGTIV